MSEINIPRDQQDALKEVDARELDKLIDQAVRDEQTSQLLRVSLNRCGPYIAGELYDFEQALAKHRLAKSAKKREETGNTLRRAGHDLSFAVEAMKRRMATEQEEGQFFQIDDQIMPPYRFSKHMSVRVSYRWRRTIEDEWQRGCITFTHDDNPRPDYTTPAPKRKPSAAKQEQDLQNRLRQAWEYLMRGALYSVRDYFREGGDGANIPEEFQVTVDSYTRGLNNYSTRFWCQQT